MEREFRFIIQSKGVLGKESLNLQTLLSKTNLSFLPQETTTRGKKEVSDQLGCVYNPEKLARGIYFDGRRADSGKVVLGISFPTSLPEICDFFRIATEVKLQYRNVQVYYEDIDLSFDELIEKRESFEEYALSALEEICQEAMTTLRLQSFVYTFTAQEQKEFRQSPSLQRLEELFHQRQSQQFCETAPCLFNDGEQEMAVFFLVEEQASILPILLEDSLYWEGEIPEKVVVSFKNKHGKALFTGYYDYVVFVELMLNFGAEKVGEKHLSLPGFTKAELEEIVKDISVPGYTQFV